MVATFMAGSLRPSYYALGYPMPYASEQAHDRMKNQVEG
jgi:hypothetical protein